jgi:Mn2+/Fe2+ NRAMP family transporter
MGLPIALALGKVGIAFALVGFVAATFGAALETTLSSGYTAAQYFGWQWGKFVRPKEAARFHALIIFVLLGGALIGLTTIDPIKVTEYAIVFSAAALPLTFFPILVIANDPDYMRDKVNSRVSNTLGTIYLIVIVVASAAAIPLMIATKAGM